MRRVLDRADTGTPGVVLLVGEPGIGKSRLAEEITRLAGLRGWRGVWGRCRVEAPAFWPWNLVVRDLYAAVSSVARHGVDPDALAPLLSDPAGPRARDRPDGTAALDHARFRLFDAVTQLVRAAAARQPLLLVLDDLHLADRASLLLLEFVAREAGALRLVIVGTYREVEARRSPRMRPLLATLARLGERLRIGGLSESETARLVRTGTLQRVGDRVVRAIHRVSQGNPFFVGELVRVMQTDGSLGEADLDRVRIPEELREVIRQRLTPLPRDVIEVLAVAALIGPVFDVVTLARAAQRTVDTVLQALDAAVQLAVIAPEPGGLGRYAFTHVLVPDTLIDDVPAGVRAAWHRRIGEAIEALAGPGTDERVDELARHFFEAAQLGAMEPGVRYALAAAERASDRLAYEQAIHHYDRAAQLLQLGGGDPSQAVQVALGRGEARRRLEQWTGARADFRDAAERARALGDHAAFGQAAIGFAAARPADGTDDPDAIALLADALAGVPADAPRLRAVVMGRLAEQLYFTDALDRALALSADATTLGRATGDPITLATVLCSRHFVSWGSGDPSERVVLADEIIASATRAGRPDLLAEGRRRRLLDLAELGELTAFDRGLADYEDAMRHQPIPGHPWQTTQWRAMRALLSGQFAEAERLIDAAYAQHLPAERPYAAQVRAMQLLAVRIEQDRFAELTEPMAVLNKLRGRSSVWRDVGTPAFLLEVGWIEEAREAFDRLAAHDFADVPRDMHYTGALATLAAAAVRLGDRPRAERLYALLASHPARTVVVGWAAVCFGSIDRYLGMLAEACGRTTAALEHYERAIAANARMGAAPYVTRARLDAGRVLMMRGASGDVAQARTLLAAALASAEHLGMAGVAKRCRELLGPDTDVAEVRLQRSGDVWTLAADGVVAHLRDSKGLRYLALLVAAPAQPLHVSELQRRADEAAATPAAPLPVGGAGADRMRLSVRKALVSAIDRLATHHPALAEHLRATVRMGHACCYEPPMPAPLRWVL